MIVYVTMGIPGSGKSYWAERHSNMFSGTEVISPDKIREMLTGDESDQTQNGRVFDLAHGRLRWLLMTNEKESIIFDATNVQKFARQNLLDICAEFGAEPTLVVFDTPRALCLERNRNRSRVVPDHAIKRMHGSFLEAMDEIHHENWAIIDMAKGRMFATKETTP